MKKEILNTLFAVGACALLLTGCGEDSKTTTETKVVKEVKTVETNDVSATKPIQMVIKDTEIAPIAVKKEPVTTTETKVATQEYNLGTCTSCHGLSWEKQALGKSKIVKDLSEETIRNSLIGYKNGTYGGAMAGVMKGQIAKYSDETIAKIAKDIKK